MGQSFSKTDINNVYKNYNELVSNASQDCIASQVNGINNIDIRLENTTIEDIEFAQKSVVNPNCVFDSNVALTAKEILEQRANVKNTSGAGLLPIMPLGLDIDITDEDNEIDIANKITSNIRQLCNFTSENQISNVTINYVNVKGGNIIFDQEGDVTGQCMLTNLAALDTQIEATQEGDADNGGRNSRGIVTAIVIIVIVIAVVLVLVALIGMFGRKKKGGEDNLCDDLKGEERALCELQKMEGSSRDSAKNTSSKV